ncbi:MAG: adenylate/guanylate cyclase domain-containing protein [Gammaproteobacteria bacterium]
MSKAAVLFADISGSTQLYVQHGDTTARTMIAKALEYLAGVTREHKGVVIKTIGDEVMCRFPSADDAYDAAIGMQRTLKDNSTEISDKTRVCIRVGLQWGEVVNQGGDVFGDAVNVAARVAAVAKRDQIVTTEQTVAALTGDRADKARQFDRVALKGREGELVLHMIDWDEEADATRMRTVTPAAPAASVKKLQLTFGDKSVLLFTEGKVLTLGRSAECSLVVATGFASRLHAKVIMRRGRYVLADESTNGSYIMPGGLGSGAQEVFIKREEYLLPDKGVFSLGQSCNAEDAKVVQFSLAAG